MALEPVDLTPDTAESPTDRAICFPDGWDIQHPFLRLVAQSRG
jgi:hypothetical protein